ncbi:TPA: hypothetical protein MFH30_004860 [Klebsiella pneumoniae]|nr:hypothetical protein [Klebsiella pneumoniae]
MHPRLSVICSAPLPVCLRAVSALKCFARGQRNFSRVKPHAYLVIRIGRRSVSAKSRDMAGEVIGVLRVCDGCGRSGGGCCPDCGPVLGNSTYNAMAVTGAFDDLEAF